MSILEQALELAYANLPVFPCGATKKPCIGKARGGRGFLDAVSEESAVRTLFKKAGDAAKMVGVPTGPDSGFDVLDLDYRNGAGQWEMENAHRLPETRMHSTFHGGRHMLFNHVPGVRNSESQIARGVDVRGDGGYVIHPPSIGYTVVSDAPIADWPTWLLELVLRNQQTPEPTRPIADAPPLKISEKRLAAFADKVIGNVSLATLGTKHPTLRAAARTLGGIQAEAGFSDESAVKRLLDALPAAEDWTGARKTALWGLEDGRKHPFTLDNRPEYERPRPRPNGQTNGQEAPRSEPEHTEQPRRIISARSFFDSFTVPDYLIDGIIQIGRVYALTSPTGHGKTAVALLFACMVAAGRPIGAIETEQARVLFLAGENPDDLAARFHAACQVHGLDPDTLPLDFLPNRFPIDPEAAELLRQEIDAMGHTYGLIIGDSIAAYFSGDNENDNVQMGASARNWRVLSTCRGTPAVIALAHPVKAPDRENLLPRGGGAFIAEIDVNLTLWAEGERASTVLHWAGKIRGADFAPVAFALTPVKLNNKADKKGRPFISVVAAAQSEEQAEKVRATAVSDENVVLELLRRYPETTVRAIAENAGWVNQDGKPDIGRVQRLLRSLRTNKLVKNWRGKWIITDAGKAELNPSQD